MDDSGRLPKQQDLVIRLNMGPKQIKYLRDALHRHDLWPFPALPNQAKVRIRHSKVQDYDLDKFNQKYKDDMMRVVAARKAKKENPGSVLQNEDIEAYL